MGEGMLIKHLTRGFDPRYIKPANVFRALETLLPPVQTNPAVKQQQQRTKWSDRRSGQDRRRRQHQVLLDLRSSSARRCSHGRRNHDYAAPEGNSTIGIDVYV